MDTNTQYSNTSSVPLQSHSTNSFHKSSQQEQPVDQSADESFAPEEKFNVVEPSKLLEQTLTTDDLPRRGSRSSVQSNMELQRRSRSTDHSTALVPASMPSDALVVANQQPESPPDIKPELLDLEPPMSPVAGPSHSTDENSMMMYMDQSSMSGMPGPSGYQDNSALVSTDSQPQGAQKTVVLLYRLPYQPLQTYKLLKLSGAVEANSAQQTNLVAVKSTENPNLVPIESTENPNPVPVESTENPNPVAVESSEKPSDSGAAIKEKKYKCLICPKTFDDHSNFMRHGRIHAGTPGAVNRPSCPFCSKTFFDSTTLKRHIRIHTGEKPFTCTICDKRFRLQSSLTIHSRVHSGEKPFKCSVCDYRAAVSSNIMYHFQRRHGNEKPYKCDHCDYRSSVANSVQKHAKRVHKLKKN